MSEHPNVARAREALETFTSGDLEAYVECFSPDVVWHVGGEHALSGDYRGRGAMLDYFQKVRETTGGSIELNAESVMANDEYCAIFARVTAQRNGKQLDVEMAQCFRYDPEGRWAEYWAMADNQAAVDAFWARTTGA